MKLIIIALLLVLSGKFGDSKRSVGAPSKVDDLDRISGLLDEHIPKLNLTVVKLIEVQQQVVSGILYKFNGIFKNAEGEFLKGDIDLWIQEWLQDENEKVKITLKNQVKLEDFNENMLRSPNSSSQIAFNISLMLTAILILTLQ